MSTIADSASCQELKRFGVQLHPLLLNQTDGRGSNVNIPTRTIAISLGLYFLEEKVTSLLKLDQELRKQDVLQSLGLSANHSSQNAPAVSDSTIRQALDGWSVQDIRQLTHWVYRTIKAEGLNGLTLPSGNHLNVGAVDSSSFGNCYSNCIAAITDSNVYPLDLVAHEQFKRGKELPAAQETIERWKNHFDLLLFDGLYLTKQVFDQLSDADSDALVKYPVDPDRVNEYPWPLGQAQYLIKKGLREQYIIHDGRYQDSILCYRVEVRDKGHEFVIYKFRVGSKEKEDFFIITTRDDLTARDIWELSHSRWGIENGAFRSLSLQNDSKGQNRKGGPRLPANVKYVLLFWLLLYQSIFRVLAHLFVTEDELKNVKVTEGWIIDRVRKYAEALLSGPRGDPWKCLVV